MATTKIWAIKDSLSRVVNYAKNPNKTIFDNLKQVIKYAENEDKVIADIEEKTMYVTGVNCNRETALEEMIETQNRFNKTTGTYHNHFVINSVNMFTGKKFNCNKGAYFCFRGLSDELCEKYNLSVIKNPKGITPRNIYFAEKRGEPTKYIL